MRIVMIVAHPDAESFCRALATTAESALARAGHTVTVLDLYQCGFRPAMTPAERHAYHSVRPILDAQVQMHADAVRGAEALVFIYPTWWSTMPAVMKGWLERVLVPGVAFGFDGHGRVRPGLTSVRHLVGISTYGSRRSHVWLMHDNGRRTLMRALRLSTGWRTRRHWLGLYSMDRATESDRRRFLQRIDAALGAL